MSMILECMTTLYSVECSFKIDEMYMERELMLFGFLYELLNYKYHINCSMTSVKSKLGFTKEVFNLTRYSI